MFKTCRRCILRGVRERPRGSCRQVAAARIAEANDVMFEASLRRGRILSLEQSMEYALGKEVSLTTRSIDL